MTIVFVVLARSYDMSYIAGVYTTQDAADRRVERLTDGRDQIPLEWLTDEYSFSVESSPLMES